MWFVSRRFFGNVRVTRENLDLIAALISTSNVLPCLVNEIVRICLRLSNDNKNIAPLVPISEFNLNDLLSTTSRMVTAPSGYEMIMSTLLGLSNPLR